MESPAVSLPDDLLVEILRRLPVRSVCRFKCVSRSWRNLISGPGHRKKLPQTLEGFFYHSWNGERSPNWAHHFTNVTGKGAPFIYPSFSFLPVPGYDVALVDSCNGLLLCRCDQHDPHNGEFLSSPYAVCNPATKKWLMLPDNNWAADKRWAGTARLGFDPTVSSHFHVIECVVDEDDEDQRVIGVEIYSSKTAAWSFKEIDWADGFVLSCESRSVFLNGYMHMLTYAIGIFTVDMEGKTWRTIPIPPHVDGCMHEAQGRLCLLDGDSSKLSIWILEDYGTHEWTLKHIVTTLQLFGQNNLHFDVSSGYKVIAIHPECNLIFFVFGPDKTLMAYEMDRKEVRAIRKLGHDCEGPYLPYVPLFLEPLAE